MSKFNSVEEAKKFLSDIENNLKQFEDEYYNLNEEIKAIDNLCQDLKASNYNLWSQSTMQEQQVQEIEENEPTIQDIIGGIEIR